MPQFLLLLRWFLFLPAAIITNLVVFPIVFWINRIDFIGEFTSLMLAHVASSILYLMVGVAIVPKKKYVVAVILTSLYVVFSLSAIGYSLFADEMFLWKKVIAQLISVILIIIYCREEVPREI